MRIGTRNKWKFVEDPCDTGNPLLTIFRNGKRIHRNPGENQIFNLEHRAELTDGMIAAILNHSA